jgi:hypothetical protein
MQCEATVAPEAKPFRFMDLPAEVREIVYKLALVRDEPIVMEQPNFSKMSALTPSYPECVTTPRLIHIS